MALIWSGIIKVATENGCDLFYEASVAGGIPILKRTYRWSYLQIALRK